MTATPTQAPGAPSSTAHLNGHRAGPGRKAAATAGLAGWTERLPVSRRQRRPALAVAGALLVLLCGVATAALATRGDQRLSVLALARDVPAGHQLTAADLGVAHIAGDGISAVSAAGANTVVGQTLTATLPPGTLLNSSMLTAVQVPAPGMQLVAVAVKPGQAPSEATAGREVTLVHVATPGAGQGAVTGPVVLVPRARVVSVHAEPSSGLVVLSVQVPDALAGAVAQANAAGAVAVTLLPVTP
ncbi:MAG: hypothetical protein JWM02_1304 [Frankiales bacterium]|nr:hypothetical protein [Frankiales bacterium]